MRTGTPALPSDNLGRRTTLANPDTGKTVTVYDAASNVIQKITANLAASGQTVTYDYDFNRLKAIHYPDSHGNDVTYEYGAAGLSNGLNQVGRIVKVTDASGSEEREYGKLGETVKEVRTIASRTQGNSVNSPEVYTTQYEYDTFGRILTLTLPDSEIITYAYDAGGNLASFAGDKAAQGAGANHTQYLQTLHYDKFEQRTYMKLGNGIETRYTYRPDNRRLKNLNSEGRTAGKFQNLDYKYDSVGNITNLANSVDLPKPGAFGGPTAQTFGYDDLYRLTSAKGNFTSSPSKVRDYTLNMGYSDIHNITSKVQTDTITTPDGSRIPQKATSYDWAYAYGAQQPHAPSHIGSHSYSYDLNGNQLGWRDDKTGARRIILWDEDNRISEILDNGHSSKYTYDDKGQRVIKETKQGETVYVNQYYVIRNRSIVSKHLFAGSSRLVTRLEMGTAPGNSYQGSGSNPSSGSGNTNSPSLNAGEGRGESNSQGNAFLQDKDKSNQGLHLGQDKQNPGQGSANAGQGDAQRNDNAQAAEHGKGKGNSNAGDKGNANSSNANNAGGNGVSGQKGKGTTNLPGNSEAGLENALANGKGNKYGIYKHLAKEGYTVDDNGDIVIEAGEDSATPISEAPPPTSSNGQSDFTYYYHPDHLGSTGFVTDANGKLYEHIEYFPFGETWVQEHSNTLRTPYLFTGKEFDQETGLYYFGARYYDPRTSVWQSADPILGKYLPMDARASSERFIKALNGENIPVDARIYRSSTSALYSYVINNPVGLVDPDGNIDITPAPKSWGNGATSENIPQAVKAIPVIGPAVSMLTDGIGSVLRADLGSFAPSVKGTLSLGPVTSAGTGLATGASTGETSLGIVLEIPLGGNPPKPTPTNILAPQNGASSRNEPYSGPNRPCSVCMTPAERNPANAFSDQPWGNLGIPPATVSPPPPSP